MGHDDTPGDGDRSDSAARSPALARTITREESLPGLDGDSTETSATIAHYELRRKLGEGGMGVVYAAHDWELDRTVALKLLRSGSPRHENRMLREARSLAKLRHPNVVTVFEVGAEQGELYIAMEYIAGQTLRHWMRGEHDWRERCAVLRQAAAGLIAAHAAGLVHRDFKPDNVIVGDDGRVQVLDFGLARPVLEQPVNALASGDTSLDTLTRTGTVVGTPAYMAPEQFRAAPVDERTDQFSFCVAAYETLYGVKPFAAETLQELEHAVLEHDITPPPADTPVPAELHALLIRGLSPRPEDRHPDLSAVAAGLEPTAAPRSRHHWTVVAAVVFAAAALAVALWALSRSGTQSASAPPADARRPTPSRKPLPGVDPAAVGSLAEQQRARARALYSQARQAYSERDFTAAARLYRKAFAEYPLTTLHYNLAETYKQLLDCPRTVYFYRRYLDAVRKLDSAKRRPRLEQRAEQKLRVLGSRCKPAPPPPLDTASAASTNWPPTGPPVSYDHATHLLERARAATRRLEWTKARALYSRVTTGKHRTADGFLGMARVSFETDKTADAIRLARDAVRAGAGTAATLLLGHAYYRSGLYRIALDQYEKTLTTAPKNREAQRGAERARHRLKQVGPR